MRDAENAMAGTQAGGPEKVAWRLHWFDHGGACYGFETTRSGDRARVVVNGKPALELPRVIWDALLDVVALQRGDMRAGQVAEVSTVPQRVGTAWDEAEDGQLRAAWKAGSTIAELATLHHRSRAAISARLKLLGLIDVDPIRAASVAEPLAH